MAAFGAAMAGREDQSVPLPTLLTPARRSAPAAGCGERRFPKAKMEITIPEPEQDLQAYPAEAVHVRNTFIHVGSPALSLPRPVGSAPARHIGRMQDLEHEVIREDAKAVSAGEPRQVLRLEEALFVPVPMPSTPEPHHALSNTGIMHPPCSGQPYMPGAAGHNPNYLSSEWQPHGQAPMVGPSHDGWYQNHSYYSEGLPAQAGASVHMPPSAPQLAPPAQHMAPPAAQHIAPPAQPLALPAQHLAPPVQHLAPPAQHLVSSAHQLAPPAPPAAPATQQLPEICAISMPVPAEPAPGSLELPSVGSKTHHTGECKPCAFLHVKGCDNGAMCKFCHLCEPGEKKRRQKAKKALFKLGGA